MRRNRTACYMRSPTLGLIPFISEKFGADFSLNMWEQICINRAFELDVAKAIDEGLLKIPVYLSIGQEHIPVAIAAVSKDFLIFAQHRAHSYYLSFGGESSSLWTQITTGKQGSASVHCPEIGMYGHSGLMGDQIPIAVGMALGSGKRVLAVCGDASVEEDYVFGAMGYAVTKKLPVLFICEDNGLSILTPVEVRRSWSMVDVASSLGMYAVDITDDPWLIAHHVGIALDQLPAFINIRTCRHRWHNGTGSDGPPEWDRFEMIREEIKCLGLLLKR